MMRPATTLVATIKKTAAMPPMPVGMGSSNGATAPPRWPWFSEAAARLVPFALMSSFHEMPEWVDINRTGHHPIISAIAAGDAEEVRGLMAAHISATGDLLLKRIDSLELWTESDIGDSVVSALTPWVGWRLATPH